MSRLPLIPALAAGALLTACAPTMGPPPRGAPAVGAAGFRADDFAWSTATGRGGVAGRLAYHQGPVRFTCANSTVILTPETPWTRRRMGVLYRSTEVAALPAEEVRARTPSAPGEDYSAYVRRTTCDAASRFSFTGLPDGAWYVITIARPVASSGANMALMKRVVTRGGRTTTVAL